MVNKIIEGMANKIRSVYPEQDYGLYTEQVEQGFEAPCFFIFPVNQEQTPRLGVRYREEYYISVQYFPAGNNANAECLDVSGELNGLLEYITADGDLIRGSGISSKVSDGVLTFLVEYTVFMRRELPKDELMKEVEVFGKTAE